MLYEHQNISTNVGVWSINGNPRYRFLYPQYLRGIKAAIVVFDVTNRESFENIEYWIGLTRNNQIERPIGFLVGNKIDSS
jgi:GTPase SAR1 family protein